MHTFCFERDTAKKLYERVSSNACLPLAPRSADRLCRELVTDRHYSNITEFLIDGNDTLKMLLLPCGVDEDAFSGGIMSDYDRFLAVCRAFPCLAGHSVYFEYHRLLSLLFDCSLFINEKNAPEIWRIFSNEGRGRSAQELICKIPALKVILPVGVLSGLNEACAELSRKVLASFSVSTEELIDVTVSSDTLRADGVTSLEELTELVSKRFDGLEGLEVKSCDAVLPKEYRFIRPDPYRAGKAFEKMLKGESLSLDDINIWHAQVMRIIGRECVKRKWTLRIGAGVTTDLFYLFDYLFKSEGLPVTRLYPFAGAESLKGILVGMPRACVPMITVCAPSDDGEHDIGRLARNYPIGAFGGLDGMYVQARDPSVRDLMLSAASLAIRRLRLCEYLAEMAGRGELDGDLDILANMIQKIFGE